MAHEQEFLCDLLDTYWGRSGTGVISKPKSYLITETIADETWIPCIAVVMGRSAFKEHGFDGRYLSYKKQFRIIMYTLTADMRSEWEDEVVRIVKTYCKYPTTTRYTSPNIDYIHVIDAGDAEDLYASATLFMREVVIECDIQRNLR